VSQANLPITKEEARAQFDYYTKKLDLKHYFTFDEAWDSGVIRRAIVRHKTKQAEVALRSTPGALVTQEEIDAVNPLKHTFADGCYIREIRNPKGELLVTKIHKIAHPYFLLEGDMSILTEHGVKRIQAPHYGVTPAGTKRIIYTHEDVVFVTVHVTQERDLDKIEEEVIAKTFDEVPDMGPSLEDFMRQISEEV